MSKPISIVGLSGSLRAQSFNSALLREAGRLVPEGATFAIADWSDFPVYNDDVFAKGLPPAVAAVRQQLADADAIVICSPEYNYSIPGGLKNAIDWTSRGADQPWKGKPVAIAGASMGMLGTARGQYHLRQVAVFLDAFVLNKPEVMVGKAQDKFAMQDGELRLKDDATRKILGTLMENLVQWTRRLQAK